MMFNSSPSPEIKTSKAFDNSSPLSARSSQADPPITSLLPGPSSVDVLTDDALTNPPLSPTKRSKSDYFLWAAPMLFNPSPSKASKSKADPMNADPKGSATSSLAVFAEGPITPQRSISEPLPESKAPISILKSSSKYNAKKKVPQRTSEKDGTAIIDPTPVSSNAHLHPKPASTSKPEVVKDQSNLHDSVIDQSLLHESGQDQSKLRDSKLHKTVKDQSKLHDSVKDQSKLHDSVKDPSKLHESGQDQSKLYDSFKDESKLHKTVTDQSKQSKLHESGKDPSKLHESGQDQSKLYDPLKDESKLHKTVKDQSKLRDSVKDQSKLRDSMKDQSKLHESGQDQSKLRDSLKDESKLYKTVKDQSKQSKLYESGQDQSKPHESGQDQSKLHDSLKDESKRHKTVKDQSKLRDSAKDQSKLRDSVKDQSKLHKTVKDHSKPQLEASPPSSRSSNVRSASSSKPLPGRSQATTVHDGTTQMHTTTVKVLSSPPDKGASSPPSSPFRFISHKPPRPVSEGGVDFFTIEQKIRSVEQDLLLHSIDTALTGESSTQSLSTAMSSPLQKVDADPDRSVVSAEMRSPGVSYVSSALTPSAISASPSASTLTRHSSKPPLPTSKGHPPRLPEKGVTSVRSVQQAKNSSLTTLDPYDSPASHFSELFSTSAIHLSDISATHLSERSSTPATHLLVRSSTPAQELLERYSNDFANANESNKLFEEYLDVHPTTSNAGHTMYPPVKKIEQPRPSREEVDALLSQRVIREGATLSPSSRPSTVPTATRLAVTQVSPPEKVRVFQKREKV